jgi:xanthine dehydrogenase small subunit
MRHTVRFLLGNEPRELAQADPTMTVLDYLRRVERRCGTKEGCAEGDCGACTVVLAERDQNGRRLTYRAVNACIQFVPDLDGRQLITVEDIGTPGTLHPVQQAMCAAHASQCGFCTPGIVMSLFAAARSGGTRGRAAWKEVLAGNLCRCTGYGPILAAAESLGAEARDDDFAAGETETLAAQAALEDGSGLALESEHRRWYAPQSLEGALALVARYPDARLVAGLTDVGLWVTKQHRSLDTVISLARVRELLAIGEDDSHIEIGAAVTLEAARFSLDSAYPALAPLIARFASRQIRNVATIGGNIANGSPIGDLAPALIALGATLVVRRSGGVRVVAVEDFFLEYGRQDLRDGELLEAVRVPKPAADQIFACYKISKRFEQDISAVMAAFRITGDRHRVTESRLAFGGMAGTPARARGAEAALTGRPFDEAAVAAAMAALDEDFAPITDMRASADYRRAIARNLILKFYLETVGEQGVSRLDAELAS